MNVGEGAGGEEVNNKIMITWERKKECTVKHERKLNAGKELMVGTPGRFCKGSESDVLSSPVSEGWINLRRQNGIGLFWCRCHAKGKMITRIFFHSWMKYCSVFYCNWNIVGLGSGVTLFYAVFQKRSLFILLFLTSKAVWSLYLAIDCITPTDNAYLDG